MINNELSLEVSNNSNQKVMRLYDTSFYYQDSAIDNFLLEVLPVNKQSWVTFNVAKKFSLVLNSSSLGYKKASEYDGLVDLPDGIYEFKLSYTPNSATVVKFYHFRITEFSNKLEKQRQDLYDNKCSLTRSEFRVNRDKLRDIEEYAKAAKWKVEECHDKAKGKEMYEFADKLLEEYSHECKC